jgi:chemotaxis family two-component system sensor kinase Cph1
VPALCPATGQPLDMSDCTLRSVSPTHVQYLKNMGAAASMSVSIVRDGTLWGLIACHHGTPRTLAYELREACKHVGQILSQQVAAREEVGLHAEGLRLRAAHDELVAILAASPLVEDALIRHIAELRAVVPSDGAAIVRGGEVAAAGRTPDPAQIQDLVAWLLAGKRSLPYATDRLSEEHAPATADLAVTSGLLAAVVSRADPFLLLWFRAEQVETIDWAGDPRKAVESGEVLGMLNPRSSFALWRETVRGRSRPWTLVETATAGRLGRAVADLWQWQEFRELNARLRRSLAEQEELVAQKDLLMREVNHRVQNSLQLVGSLLRLQAASAGGPAARAQFEEAERRLAAVAMVHRRLWRSDQIRQVSFDSYLRELRDGLVQSWGPAWDEHVQVRAVLPVLVPTDKAVTLALVVTELVTNAVKHAYGGETGPIDIEVGEEAGGTLRIMVADNGSGGATDRSEGFGPRLVGLLVGQLGGTLERLDNQPGTRIVIRIKARSER